MQAQEQQPRRRPLSLLQPDKPGHVEPGTSARHLLDDGSVAVAIAAAGLRTIPPARSDPSPCLAGLTNDVARETAGALAAKLGATLSESRAEPVDLIVFGLQPAPWPATS